MKKIPLVSIIVPCFNQEDFIDEALQSVYAQTYTNWECIVMNDGSTDRSEEKVQQWLAKDSRFRYYYKQNGGVSETRNHAIERATGEYILPLDGDDKLHQNYVEQAMLAFKNSPNTKLVYCDTIRFGTQQGTIGSEEYSFEKLLKNNMIPCTGIFKKIDFDHTKGYNTNMIYGLEDWDFWISLLHKDDSIIKLKENLVYYRIKEVSRSTIIKEQEEKNEAMLLQIFKNNQEKYLQYYNPIRNKIAADYYKEQNNFLLKSSEYTIGKIICHPFRLLQKVWTRIVR